LLVGLLGTLVALVPVHTWGEPLSAGVVAVEGATNTFQVRDWNGQLVEVKVPSQSLQGIRTSNGGAQPMHSAAQTDKTVPVTVVSKDEQRNLVTVRTQYDQIVVLNTSTRDVQVGDRLTLVLPW
jgi:hypothetical protein